MGAHVYLSAWEPSRHPPHGTEGPRCIHFSLTSFSISKYWPGVGVTLLSVEVSHLSKEKTREVGMCV